MKLSKRTLANRENAKRATAGPVTVQGKWRSSRNALTQGFASCASAGEAITAQSNAASNAREQATAEFSMISPETMLADPVPGVLRCRAWRLERQFQLHLDLARGIGRRQRPKRCVVRVGIQA